MITWIRRVWRWWSQHEAEPNLRTSARYWSEDSARVLDPSSDDLTEGTLRGIFLPLRQIGEALTSIEMPENVGPYLIQGELGFGGMGQVFLAKHRQNGHPVALKFLNPRWNTVEGRGRFGREIEALAALNHPNIAALHWGSENLDERAYLAIEYIEDALELDRYCDNQRLTLPRRLALFLEICKAVDHAHSRGVIHRDIKPRNVLVSGEETVKLIDFGIARFLDDQEGMTGTGSAPRTPGYASPEQVFGEPPSTLMDVFSLGALLYNMMTGSAPLPETAADSDSMRVFLKGAGILRPGERVLIDDSIEVSSTRGFSSPSRLASALRGDIDAVVEKAVSVKVDERYQSVRELAEDVQNLLDGNPVTAKTTPFPRYLMFEAKRHKRASLSLLGILFLLVVGLLYTQWRLSLAREERNRAHATATYLESIFKQYDPVILRAGDLPAHELLDQAADRLVIYDHQPATKAQVSLSLASIFIDLGWWDRADELIQDVLASYSGGKGETRVLSLANSSAATLRCAQGRIDEAAGYANEAARLAKGLGAEEAEFFALGALGTVHMMRGEFPQAIALFEELAANDVEDYPLFHEQAVSNLAWAYAGAGRNQDAEKTFVDLLAIRTKTGGGNSPILARTWLEVGEYYLGVGEISNAEHAFASARRTIETCCGIGHHLVSVTTAGLGRCALAQEQYWLALTRFTTAERVARQSLGNGANPYLAYIKSFSAQAMILTGDVAGAQAAGEWLLKYGQDAGPFYRGHARHVLGVCAQMQGEYGLSLPLLTQSLGDLRENYGIDHHEMVAVLTNLAYSLDKLGRSEEAAACLVRAVAICDHWYGPDHPRTVEAKNLLADHSSRL